MMWWLQDRARRETRDRAACAGERDARRRAPQHLARWARAVVLAAGELVGCQDLDTPSVNQVLRSLGVTDAHDLPPEDVLVLCDNSPDSTCDGGGLDEQLQLIGRYLFARPGSSLEVHVLGAHASETMMLGRIAAPPRTDRGPRALQSQERRFLDAIHAQVCRPAAGALQRARPRRSELAAAFTLLALTPPREMPRHIVVMSDLREYSDILDAECRPLPTRSEWLARLRRHGLLAPGSLGANTRVHFARAIGGHVTGRGCAWDVSRDIALRALWSAALEGAGARAVTFSTDVVDLAHAEATPATTSTTEPNGGNHGSSR